MFINTFAKIGVVLTSALIAGCSAQPEVTRILPAGIVQQGNLSALSRQFMAQTPYTINFDFDMDNIDGQAQAALDVQAQWILAHPDVRFSVFGHTDKVGSNAYNEDLGMRRATNAVAYLTSKGINPDRLEAMITYGEELPIVVTENRERLNRRAITVVMGYFTPEVVADGSKTNPIVPTEPPVIVVVVTDPDQEPQPEPEPEPDSGKHPNSGRGNGDEDGDPGSSEGKNEGGDEV